MPENLADYIHSGNRTGNEDGFKSSNLVLSDLLLQSHSTSWSVHNLPKLHWSLRAKRPNTWAYGGHFIVKPQQMSSRITAGKEQSQPPKEVRCAIGVRAGRVVEMTLSWALDAKMQDLVSVLLGLGIILIRSFLTMFLFFSLGMGMFTHCHCILGLCNLAFGLFIFC